MYSLKAGQHAPNGADGMTASVLCSLCDTLMTSCDMAREQVGRVVVATAVPDAAWQSGTKMISESDRLGFAVG